MTGRVRWSKKESLSKEESRPRSGTYLAPSTAPPLTNFLQIIISKITLGHPLLSKTTNQHIAYKYVLKHFSTEIVTSSIVKLQKDVTNKAVG